MMLVFVLLFLPLIDGARIDLTPTPTFISIPSAKKSSAKFIISGTNLCEEERPACLCYSGPQAKSHLSNHPCPPDFIYYCFYNTGAISNNNIPEYFVAAEKVELNFTVAGLILHSSSGLLPPNLYNLENFAQKAVKISFLGCSAARAYLEGDIGENPTLLGNDFQYERVSTLSYQMEEYIFQGGDTLYLRFKGIENINKICLCYSSTTPSTASDLECPIYLNEHFSQICFFITRNPDDEYFISAQRGQTISLYDKQDIEIGIFPTKILLKYQTGTKEGNGIKFHDCYRTQSSKMEKCLRIALVGDIGAKVFGAALVKGKTTATAAV